MREDLLCTVNKSSLGERWWVSFCFPSFLPTFHPGWPKWGTGGKNSKRNTVRKRGIWGPQKVGEIFFSSFFLFQPCPKVSPSRGAVLQWWWWNRHQKPHKITYHSKQRNWGKRSCHLWTAGEPPSFYFLSFSSLLGPTGGPSHAELYDGTSG